MPACKPRKLVIVKSSNKSINNYIDMIDYLLANISKNPKTTMESILNINQDTSRGFRFEALSFVLALLKCISGFDYTECHEGTISTHTKVSNLLDFLSRNIKQGNNDIDMCFVNDHTTIVASCKHYQSDKLHKDKQSVNNIKMGYDMHNQKRLANGKEEENYKIALFVRDKNVVLQHKYKDKNGIEKTIIEKVIRDKLLFDESDIMKAIACFNERFSKCHTIDDVLSLVDFNFKRKQLVKMLHQRLAEKKFQKSFNINTNQNWCISHKPRSGKSITLLLIAKHMLSSGFKRVLMLTSVPATFESFHQALDTYIDFKGINHISQDKCRAIPHDFVGVIFCSVQFLKTGLDKVDLIKSLNFEGIIADESHLAISTNKTKSTLLMNSSVHAEEIDHDVDSLCSTAKCCVFASGTSLKTLKYYKIPASRNYTWDIEDESFMKAIGKQENDASTFEEAMKLRHGSEYGECRNDITLNQDYSKYPTLVLMRFRFPESIVSQIDEYNKKNKADIGLSFKSILALRADEERLDKEKKKKACKDKKKGDSDNTKVKYLPQFKLEDSADGCDMLKAVFEQIISRSINQDTIIKKCETTQSNRNSRINSDKDPKLIIIYLPVNTGNSTIHELQKATKTFIEKHNLWPKYTVEYTSSQGDSCDIRESYDKKIQSMLKKTKDENKRGCVLLLGNQGRVGITYKDCDITISLDDGHNLEQKKQSDYRAMTEAQGKTIGINVDMNVQRYYANIMSYLAELRERIGQKSLSNEELLHFAYINKILVVGPDEFSDCVVNEREVTSYFKKLASEIAAEIDDSIVLESFDCDDDLRNVIITDIKTRKIAWQVEISDEFDGLQKELDKGDVKPVITRETTSKEQSNEQNENEVSDEVIEEITNKTLEIFKQYLLPLLALISRATKMKDFCGIIESTTLSKPVWEILGYKKIELEQSKQKIAVDIMKSVLENNETIVSQIREIYETASPSRLRILIERHFIPSEEEKKGNAEIPTPVILVDNMLDKVPSTFWTSSRKVYEPCCGKGNFVLGIFDKFFTGLETNIPDEIERCKIIAKDCIYFADISPLNVFITTELLKCHIQSYCGIDEFDYEFNSYVGDTLEFDPLIYWNVDGFHAVVGNPPYQNKNGNKGTGNTLWDKFVNRSLNVWLNQKGFLVFVHPRGWRQYKNQTGAIMKSYQIHYLNMNSVAKGIKMFKCSTDYDYYIIEKTPIHKPSRINDYNDEEYDFQISQDMPIIPNHSIKQVMEILTKERSEGNGFICSQSAYEGRRQWMSNTKSQTYKYPCVYSIDAKNVISKKWSSRNDNGHFGIPKFIFSNGNGYHLDYNGEYGLTQWAYAITCSKDEMKMVETVYKSRNFNNIVDAIRLTSNKYNYNVMKLFKKEFWKEFI